MLAALEFLLISGWVNRFAHAGDTAVEIAGTTSYRFRQAKDEIVSASKVAYRFLAGVTSNNSVVSSESPDNSTRGSPRFQTSWFKNLIPSGAKQSGNLELDNQDEDATRQKQSQDVERSLRLNSRHDA